VNRSLQDLAVIACDLDPIDCHLAGYGISGLPPCDLIYRRAVPRLLEMLEELGLRAVFFVVARDASSEAALLRSIRGRGHEVASHSLTHPQPFRTLDDAALRSETFESRLLLSAAVGEPILGFRAPAWDVDARVLRAIGAAGYLYDASVFPSPALALGRVVANWRGSSGGPIRAMRSSFAWAPLRPHRVGEDRLVEFPVAVSPRLRLPAYHTMSHLIPRRLFGRILEGALRAPSPLSYELHAADLLELDGDDVDRRMSVHPGMQTSLGRKIEVLREVFNRIAGARRVVTYREVLDEMRLPAAAGTTHESRERVEARA
jgi:hypothetical protein